MVQEVAPTFASAHCTSDSTDGECVRRCLRGETEAFDEIVLRYQRPVFNAIFHMVNDYEDTRELSQSAFMKAFMHLKSFDQRRPFFSWLYRIAINEAINHLSAKRIVEPIATDLPSPAAGPAERLEAKEIGAHLEAAMATLQPDYHAAVVLRHSLGLSYDQAAEVAGIPVKTFKSRLYSARQLLRLQLAAKGLGRHA